MQHLFYMKISWLFWGGKFGGVFCWLCFFLNFFFIFIQKDENICCEEKMYGAEYVCPKVCPCVRDLLAKLACIFEVHV